MLAEAMVEMEARNPAANRLRRWRLESGRDLFGAWIADLQFGRIGSRDRSLRRVFACEPDAQAYVQQGLRADVNSPQVLAMSRLPGNSRYLRPKTSRFRAKRLGAHAIEGLRQIGDQIVGAFDSRREAEQVTRHYAIRSLHRRSVFGQALHPAKRRRGKENTQALGHNLRRLEPATNRDGKHAAETGSHLPLGYGLAWVTLQPGINTLGCPSKCRAMAIAFAEKRAKRRKRVRKPRSSSHASKAPCTPPVRLRALITSSIVRRWRW
jgi:hypothetical protein